MVKLVNRAKMKVASGGAGDLTLGSASDGYQTFASAGVTNGQTVRYTIVDGNNWELGSGVYTASGTTLARTPAESSNSGNAITCSATAEIFITATAADMKPTLSTSAPTGAVSGDEWVDTATLKKYFYYDDGSSAQWVQV